MNKTRQSLIIAQFAHSYGHGVCIDLETRAMHTTNTNGQGSWTEKKLFSLINAFNASSGYWQHTPVTINGRKF